MPSYRFSLLLACAVLAWAGACAKKQPLTTTGTQGDKYFNDLGKKALENKDWEDARSYFKQLIDSYPRSNLVADARLGVADSYFFQRGSTNLVLAIAEYRDFLTFFPNHPRADYAQYQIASAYHKQINKPDRDQAPTIEAVAELKKLTDLYKNSLYAEKGRDLLALCHDRLAEHEFTVGSFNLKHRKNCRGAIARFKVILQDYPTYAHKDEVYFQLGEAYRLCRSPLEAMPYYQQVISDYPKSEFKDDAQQILTTLKAEQAAEGEKVTRKP